MGNRNSKRLSSVNAIAPLLLQSTEGYLKKPQVEFAHKVTFSVSTVLRRLEIMEKLPRMGAGWQVLGTERWMKTGDKDTWKGNRICVERGRHSHCF